MKDSVVRTLKDFRPRLDQRELYFFVHVLRCQRVRLWERFREYRAVDGRVYHLKREVHKGATYPEAIQLGRAKRKLKEFDPTWIQWEDFICRSLIWRLEAWLKGEFRYPGMFAESMLTDFLDRYGLGTKK